MTERGFVFTFGPEKKLRYAQARSTSSSPQMNEAVERMNRAYDANATIMSSSEYGSHPVLIETVAIEY